MQCSFKKCFFYNVQVRVFRFLTGKKTRVFDESLKVFTEMQQVGYKVCEDI